MTRRTFHLDWRLLFGPWARLGLAGWCAIIQGLTVSAASGTIGI